MLEYIRKFTRTILESTTQLISNIGPTHATRASANAHTLRGMKTETKTGLNAVVYGKRK